MFLQRSARQSSGSPSDAVRFKSAPSIVAADRRAALPRETVANAGSGWSAKPPPVTMMVPRPAARMGGSGDLCDDDGTNDVDRVGRLQVGDARAQQLVRSSHDRVVHDQPRCSIPAVERTHSATQIFGVAGIHRHRVDIGTGVSQRAGELAEAIGAPSGQGHPVSALGEATRHGFSEAGPGADQQQVTAVNRASAFVGT
jgi:hypothetical protein